MMADREKVVEGLRCVLDAKGVDCTVPIIQCHCLMDILRDAIDLLTMDGRMEDDGK